MTEAEKRLQEALDLAPVGALLVTCWIIEIPGEPDRRRGHMYLKQADKRWSFHNRENHLGETVTSIEISVAYDRDTWSVM